MAANLLFATRLRDPNCPFKIFRRSAWLELRERVPPGTLAPSIFLAVLLARRGQAPAQIEVPHRERSSGSGSLRPLRLAGFCVRALGQLLALRLRGRPSTAEAAENAEKHS
jgi:hypothetical protein